MADKIQLTPAELQAQAAEMRALQDEYNAFFSKVSSELKSVNGNWSPNLSHGFEGKIVSAQKSFTLITQELINGAKVADACAVSFATVDSELAKLYCDAVQSSGSGMGAAATTLGEAIKQQFAELPENIGTISEALQWIEEQYGEAPSFIRSAVDLVVPGTLKGAYSATSDLLQGNFGEAANTIVSVVAKKNEYLSGVVEAFKYTFSKGTQRADEMESQIIEQISEGDVLGVVFDGAEGFVDTIVAGSVECLFKVGGGAIDGFIDEIPVLKGINMGVSYLTGVINDGDGKSLGDLVGLGGEVVSAGIDFATDVVTGVTDVATDIVTNGVKAVGSWIGSWF